MNEKMIPLADGRGEEEGWARSQIIQSQESLVLYTVNHSILSAPSPTPLTTCRSLEVNRAWEKMAAWKPTNWQQSVKHE